jgi:hypothetical protein
MVGLSVLRRGFLSVDNTPKTSVTPPGPSGDGLSTGCGLNQGLAAGVQGASTQDGSVKNGMAQGDADERCDVGPARLRLVGGNQGAELACRYAQIWPAGLLTVLIGRFACDVRFAKMKFALRRQASSANPFSATGNHRPHEQEIFRR